MSDPLVLIAAGGTAGHVVPALAVADALRERGAHVVFVGGERAERELIPAAGYELHSIRVLPLPRRAPTRVARAALVDAAAVRNGARLLARLRPAAIVGAGGYVAGPVGLAAAVRRTPIILMESDSHLGIANRLLVPAAARVCLAFPIAGREGGRYLVTGRAIPAPATDRNAARQRFGLADDDQVVLVFGGSLGARSINHAAIAAFGGAGFRVLHVAGARDFADLRSPGSHYDLREYIHDFNQALLAAELVGAGSGGSVFEVAAHGRPMVLVPYPHATADHQAKNARYFAQGGAAVVIPDSELTGSRLALEVGRLLGDQGQLAAMSRAARSLARPEAAREIADQVLDAARNTR